MDDEARLTAVVVVERPIAAVVVIARVGCSFDPHTEYGKQTAQAETDAGQVVLPVFASHSPLTSSKHGAA